MIATSVNRFMELYPRLSDPRVDSLSESHQLITRDIPSLIRENKRFGKYYIKGSDGVGQRTFYPWICLMNDTITRSPQKGLYIAILFQKDMKGFYITLNQGITYFKQTFKKDAYQKADEAAKYFRDRISDLNFSHFIKLGSTKGDNGYGFEKTTVVAKKFKKGLFSDDEFLNTLEELADIYDDIIDTIDGFDYESIIPKIVNDQTQMFVDAEEAITEIREILYKGKKPPKHYLKEVKPRIDAPKRFKEISTPSNRKIDYVKRAQDNAEIGLLGEELVLAYEIERLNLLGLEKYALKVKQVSLENDVLGYDILSYDINEKGIVHQIFIEVKATTSKKDTDFFVSHNEVVKSKELDGQYWLYRLYDCNVRGGDPKFYRVNGPITDNFTLDAITYRASLKKGANVISATKQKNEADIKTIKAML
ncbi:MAG: DUF3578 domain-containing protein [Bacilli bacterium]|nr:DUF3578 domain-containing protein [Bacilli bacterium]